VTASLGYAQRLGFDRRRQQARLALVGLQRTDPAIAERLQTEVIRPNAQAIVRGFLDWLRHHPEPRRHLREVDWGGLARRVDETEAPASGREALKSDTLPLLPTREQRQSANARHLPFPRSLTPSRSVSVARSPPGRIRCFPDAARRSRRPPREKPQRFQYATEDSNL